MDGWIDCAPEQAKPEWFEETERGLLASNTSQKDGESWVASSVLMDLRLIAIHLPLHAL